MDNSRPLKIVALQIAILGLNAFGYLFLLISMKIGPETNGTVMFF